MNESYVTLQGWVGNNVEERVVGDTTCARFRVGCTPRYLKDGAWVDGETSWYSVNCWRGLARNVAGSIRCGDAVVVHGRVRVDRWERDGQQLTTWVIDARFVGHDLNRGVSRFAKNERRVQPESAGLPGPASGSAVPTVPGAPGAPGAPAEPAEPAA